MTATHSPVDPKLLEILVCPVTKQALEYDRENNELISPKAGLAYPIRDGIPMSAFWKSSGMTVFKRALAPSCFAWKARPPKFKAIIRQKKRSSPAAGMSA